MKKFKKQLNSVLGGTNCMQKKICSQSDIELFISKPTEFILRLQEGFKDIVKVNLGMGEFVFVFNSEYANMIFLNTNTGRTSFSKMFEPIAGGSLILNDGAVWRKQRTTLATFFRENKIDIDGVVNIAEELLIKWYDKLDKNERIDVQSTIVEYCMEVLSLILYGKENDKDKLSIIRVQWDVALSSISNIMSSTDEEEVLKYEDELKFASKKIEEVIYQIMEEKRERKAYTDDFLSYLLIQAEKQEGDSITLEEVMQQIKGLYMAGFETISSVLSWFLSDLSSNLDYQEKIRAEVCSEDFNIKVDNGYMKLCFNETLRLHPPLIFIDRRLDEDINLGEFILEAGNEVLICPYSIHRDSRYWEKPNEYMPERFIDFEGKESAHSYIPYGGGQMKCMGERLSVIQRNIFIRALLRKFKLNISKGKSIEEDSKLALRPLELHIEVKRCNW